MEKSKIYTRKEVLETLRVCERTLINWEKRKVLIPTRLGRRVYYTEEQLTRALERGSTGLIRIRSLLQSN